MGIINREGIKKIIRMGGKDDKNGMDVEGAPQKERKEKKKRKERRRVHF